jgi:hypothetical protein
LFRSVEQATDGGTHSSLISRNRRARIRIEKTDTVGDNTGRDKGEYDAPKHLKECAGEKPRFVVVRISSHEDKIVRERKETETSSVQYNKT